MSKQHITAKKQSSSPSAVPKFDNPQSYKFVRNFIAKHRSGSLATVDNQGRPAVSIVYCVTYPDLSIYFSTRVEGRKYLNLMEKPNVALAFQNEGDVQMLQLSGIAQRVDDLDTEQKVMQDLMKLRHGDPDWPPPPLRLFQRGATNEIAIIKVTPYEMTYADFKTNRTGHYKPFFQKIL